jgi:hypothetical protein
VKPSVQAWHSSYSAVRKGEVTLTQRQIGHTHISHGHLLRGEPIPLCINCGIPLSVVHILKDCPRYGEARNIYHLHGVLSDILLDDCHCISSVLAFINAVGLATSI